MRRHIEVHNVTTVMAEDDEYIEDTEGGRRDGEKVKLNREKLSKALKVFRYVLPPSIKIKAWFASASEPGNVVGPTTCLQLVSYSNDSLIYI